MNQVIGVSLIRGEKYNGVPDSELPGERLLMVIFSYNMTTVSSSIPTHGNYHHYHGYVLLLLPISNKM